MTTKPTPQAGAIMPFPDLAAARLIAPHRRRADKAGYIAQMALELERLAATADMEVLAYFLAMARAEALSLAGEDQPG